MDLNSSLSKGNEIVKKGKSSNLHHNIITRKRKKVNFNKHMDKICGKYNSSICKLLRLKNSQKRGNKINNPHKFRNNTKSITPITKSQEFHQ